VRRTIEYASAQLLTNQTRNEKNLTLGKLGKLDKLDKEQSKTINLEE